MDTTEIKNTVVSLSEWESKYWQIDFLPFHRQEVHIDLVKYEKQLLPKACSRIFVPFCGKTIDLKYLADKGHIVVGLEFSKKAVTSFFDDHSLEYKKESNGPLECYETSDRKIKIYCGDVFQASSALIGSFDAVWDRAGFTSINASDRNRFVKILSSILKPNGRYLLNSYLYDDTKFGGPPHSLSDNEIQKCFSRCFKVTFLDRYTYMENYYKERGLDVVNIQNHMMLYKINIAAET